MKICKVLLGFFLCFYAFCANSEELNVFVDKNTLTESDTVFLTIEYTGTDAQNLDLNGLQDNFNIVSNSTSNQFTYVNGQLSQAKKWILELSPQKLGKITIKPIKMGNLQSNYTEVDVKEVTNVAYVPDSQENTNSPYFKIEQSFDTKEPYVQQQVIITLTVYDSIGLQNPTMNIREDSLKNWIITPLLDRPNVRQDVINGKKMNIITFSFAAFPQKSGELIAPQISFEGYYLKSNASIFPDFDDLFVSGLSILDNIGQKVPVRMKTKTQKIAVKPIPDNVSKPYWLPLKDLKIEENSSEVKFKAGEAFNRRITIKAVGSQEKNLPQLYFPSSNEFKQYPEKPVIQENTLNGNIVTTTTTNVVYIPTKSGTYTLPAMDIEWFNVNTNQFEKAVLPAKNINVLPNPNIVELAKPKKEKIIQQPVMQRDNLVKETTKHIKTNVNSIFTNTYIKLALYVLAGLFLLLLLKSVLHKKVKNPYTKKVIASIKKRDYSAAKTALIEWAKIKYKNADINNFQKLADYVKDDDFDEQLHELNKLLYSNSETQFDVVKFIATFKKIDKIRMNVRKNSDVLPNLYK